MFSKFCLGKLYIQTILIYELHIRTYAHHDFNINCFCRFIYTGQIFYDSCKCTGWISLLDGVNKFEMLDLLAAIESYLIEKQKEWIQQNIITVYKHALSTAPLKGLLAYCNRLMASHPDIVFQ